MERIEGPAARRRVPAPYAGIPDVAIADIAAVLRARYTLNLERAQPTGGEYHLNLRAETTTGRYLVKVSTPDGAEPETWRDRILLHVRQRAPEIPVPRIVRSADGDVSVLWTDSAAHRWQVRVYDWLPGKLLAQVTPRPGLLAALGETSARVTEALGDFTDRSMTAHMWDFRTASATIRNNLKHVFDQANRDAVLRVLDAFAAVEPLLATLPVTVVHHDLNDHNILVSDAEGGTQRITGVLDFNDALHTYRVADVAIAAAYAMLRRPDPIAAAGEVVSGYCSRLPMTEAEIEVIFPLAAVRLCLNATLWTSRTRQDADTAASSYGRRRMADTWPAIWRLTHTDHRTATRQIWSAIGARA